VIILERALEGVSAASLARFARRAQQLAGCRGEVNVLVAGNRRLQELNRAFRGKDLPTDVLSFPRNREDGSGGDIAISADLARSNAKLHRHSASDELRILILHGMLHLAGHDHETDGGRMAKIEARLRSQLKLPSSLIERAASSDGKDFRSKKRSAARIKPALRRSSR
jgi:probable rRNA maturation factor